MLQERVERGLFARVGAGAVTCHRMQSSALSREPAPGLAEASAQTWWSDLSQLLAHCSVGDPEQQEKLWVKVIMVIEDENKPSQKHTITH